PRAKRNRARSRNPPEEIDREFQAAIPTLPDRPRHPPRAVTADGSLRRLDLLLDLGPPDPTTVRNRTHLRALVRHLAPERARSHLRQGLEKGGHERHHADRAGDHARDPHALRAGPRPRRPRGDRLVDPMTTLLLSRALARQSYDALAAEFVRRWQ